MTLPVFITDARVRSYDARVGDSGSRVRALAGRTATFVKERPRSQQLVGGGLALALATAPFGGLRAVSADHDVQPLRLGEEVRVGPFAVTVTKVRSVGDLAPSYAPEGARVFAVVAEVVNATHTPVAMHQLTQAVVRPADARLAKDVEAPDAVLDYVDGSSIDPGDPVNPGLRQTVVWAWPQDPAWTGGTVTLAFDQVAWYEPTSDDHLSAAQWQETGDLGQQGRFDVEPAP